MPCAGAWCKGLYTFALLLSKLSFGFQRLIKTNTRARKEDTSKPERTGVRRLSRLCRALRGQSKKPAFRFYETTLQV